MVVKNPGFGIREMWIQNTALKKKIHLHQILAS